MRHDHAIEPPRHQMGIARVDRVPERGRIRRWNGTKVREDGRDDRIEPRIRQTALEHRRLRGLDAALQQICVLAGRWTKVESVQQASRGQTLRERRGWAHP